MVYLTYNDYPSGIYSSQVLDVCSFLNTRLNATIRVVALVSLRTYFRTKKEIQSKSPGAIVLPMFPGIVHWRANYYILYFLFLFIGKQSVVARGLFAATLAMKLKEKKMCYKVCFDARGAYVAEFNEYDVAASPKINKDIFAIEKNAVLNCDFRIAVSHKLVSYWKGKYAYEGNKHVVIPCTVNSGYFQNPIEQTKIAWQRQKLGYESKDIVLVYSGSSAGWQSFNLMDDFLCSVMKYNDNIKVLLLTGSVPVNMVIGKIYPERVLVKWFGEPEVMNILFCCDYGLLIREQSITNSVASPVKFAEYLAAGLKVLISPRIGDYSDFVQKYNCGYVIDSNRAKQLYTKPSLNEKQSLQSCGKENFLKEIYFNNYANMYSNII
jgi:glycosyltransferase involved in cell wall biosynthesis